MIGNKFKVTTSIGVMVTLLTVPALLPVTSPFLDTSSIARAQDETEFYDNGIALMGQKKYAEAANEFRKSIKADPRYKEAWQALADALRADGKTDQAELAQKMAEAASAARAGTPPPLTTEQQQALGETAANPAPVPGNPIVQITPVPVVATGAAPLPVENSAIVNKNGKGGPAVAEKNGKPIEGTKLSRHDTDIYSPSIAVAPNGTIHVTFVEKHAQYPFDLNVYHRSSSDAGTTWSEAKNLSEVMPGYQVGNCQVAVDSANRAYVIWHTGVAENFSTDMDAHAMPHNNLVYRVLDNGKWSGKAIPVHPLFTKDQENNAGASWFVSTDPTGKVHVIWNMRPDSRHPEALTKYGKSPAVGSSMVMEATLNGTDAGTPREIFSAKIAEDPGYHMPGSDNLDTIEGYVDAADTAHFIAHVSYAGIGPTDPSHRIHLIENGKQTPVVDLPNRSFSIWHYPPQLLLDAKGQRHIIAMYEAGEQQNVRDYLVGSDEEPTVIRAAREVKGKLNGFQAYQGPNGRMIVLMEMNDTGNDTDDDLYLSTSDGKAWSTPVNVTNNNGRQVFFSKATSPLGSSHVDSYSYWYPGAAAAAYDRQGHLLLVHVSNKFSIVQSVASGWTLAGGSTRTPNLLFLRF